MLTRPLIFSSQMNPVKNELEFDRWLEEGVHDMSSLMCYMSSHLKYPLQTLRDFTIAFYSKNILGDHFF